MRENTPSKTAYRVALRRAAHQLLDHPRIFEDPVALPILGPNAGDLVRNMPESATSRHMRAFMAVRSRFAEDELASAIGRGAVQYVILGAGLDTYGYRNSAGVRVFEVDFPATQEWKRGLLAAAGIPIPESLTFVPADFEHQTLHDALSRTAFDPHAMTFFSWLGVTPYLTLEAMTATLAVVAGMPAGSGVVFDYAVERSALRWMERLALDALAARVAAAGEPFRLFFTPEELARMLRRIGFTSLEDLDRHEINRRYFEHRSDGLAIAGGLGRLMSAKV
jgi:methyltransferase (TIGR00027 family)